MVKTISIDMPAAVLQSADDDDIPLAENGTTTAYGQAPESVRMSETPSIPDHLKDFLLRHIDSVTELEALLLLRAEPHPWSSPALARRLYIDEPAAHRVLTALHRRGLVVSLSDDGGFRYSPLEETLQLAVDALAQAYPVSLIPITHLIHSKPPSALRNFADAFKLREG